MTAKVVGYKDCGRYIMVFFKAEDSKSWKVQLDKSYRNYARWSRMLTRFLSTNGDIWLKGLIPLNRVKHTIDGDSLFERTAIEGTLVGYEKVK